MRLELLRDQMLAGDLDLVFENVSRYVDHLHTVPQGRIDISDVVGRSDEQHLRQVVLGIEVVVVEGRVLLRIEHFEQGRRRVAMVADGDLVDLVQYHDRIRRAASLDRLDDPARHRADVGLAVSANLGLVVQAAQRDASELALERPGHRFAERRLADTRRAVQAQDRRLQVALELDDGQMFQNAVLHLVQTEMVVIEPLLGVVQVQIVFRIAFPRQFEHQLQVVELHGILGYGRIHPLQLR